MLRVVNTNYFIFVNQEIQKIKGQKIKIQFMAKIAKLNKNLQQQ